MSKMKFQMHNAQLELSFDYLEDINDFIDYLRSGDNRYSSNLNAIADGLKKNIRMFNSRDDLKLIPQIIKAINTHVRNVGDLNKFGSSSLTGWIATELTYDKNNDNWYTDNGYVIDGSLKYNLMWLTDIAPQYWNMK